MSDFSAQLSGNFTAQLSIGNPCAALPVLQPDIELIESIAAQFANGLPWQEIAASGAIEVNKAYAVTGNALTLLSLPNLPNGLQSGYRILVYNLAASNFRITQASGQIVRVGNTETTMGEQGKIESRSIGDWIELSWLNFAGSIGWICTGIYGNLEIS